jgi:hypothetical protein
MADVKPDAKAIPLCSRLTGLRFLESVYFAGGEVMSVSLLSNGGDGVDAIVAARVTPDGPVACAGNERADMYLLRRKRTDRATGEQYVDQCGVGFANVRSFVFGR